MSQEEQLGVIRGQLESVRDDLREMRQMGISFLEHHGNILARVQIAEHEIAKLREVKNDVAQVKTAVELLPADIERMEKRIVDRFTSLVNQVNQLLNGRNGGDEDGG